MSTDLLQNIAIGVLFAGWLCQLKFNEKVLAAVRLLGEPLQQAVKNVQGAMMANPRERGADE